MSENTRLYVDARLANGAYTATRTVVFGPYEDRSEAERALTTLAARENCVGAIIRNPEA